MLKRLAAIAVFLAVAQAFMPTSGQTSNNNRGKGYADNSKASPSQKKSTNPKVIPQPPTSSEPKDEASAEHEETNQQSVTITEAAPVPSKRDWVDHATLLIGVVIALITGFGVLAAWLGLPEFKRQADAAKQAANAAFLNAQAVINSERAWMFIEIAIPTGIAGAKTIYDMSCVNRGKTPARITDCRTGQRFIDDPENLLLKDTDYHRAVMPFPTIKAPDNGFPVAAQVNPAARKPDDGFFLMYFGKVLYEDIFPIGENGEFGKHETWWCFAYSPTLDSLTPSGPDRYTKNT